MTGKKFFQGRVGVGAVVGAAVGVGVEKRSGVVSRSVMMEKRVHVWESDLVLGRRLIVAVIGRGERMISGLRFYGLCRF